MNVRTADSITERIAEGARAAADDWNRFWFRPADPFSLGLIRVLTGLMLTYNLLVWSIDLSAFFGADGLQPLSAISALHANSYAFSILTWFSPDWLYVVHWCCVGIAVLFCVGFCTRVTAIAAFVITISYSQRVPIANFGLDQILGLLCLYLAIGPSGAALSFDSWWRRRKAAQLGQKFEVTRLPAARMALRLIQIHVCIIYFWAGFAKLKGDSWWTGEAMWQVIANLEYQTLSLTWMAKVPWLPYLLAHATVAWEVFFCVLVWNRRLRPLMLAIGTAMHIGIGAFLGMWTFGLIMTFPYIAFANSSRWRRLAIWRTSQPDEKVGFATPPPVDDEPEHNENEAPPSPEDDDSMEHFDDVEVTAEPETESVPVMKSGQSGDEIIGTSDAATEPAVVIDYRSEDNAEIPADNSVEGTDSETRVIDDEFLVGGTNADHGLNDVFKDDSDSVRLSAIHSTIPQTPEISDENHGQSAETLDPDPLNSGAAMSENSKSPASKNEMSVSRMERIKPKSANSVTGAPPPKIDGRVEESVLAPETEVLLVALHAPERNTFRTYLRRHDIPCRAATSTENAVSIVVNMKPAAVLLSGSCLNPEEIITLVDDLNDMVEAPILALLSISQIKLLSNDPLSAHVLQYPASLRQIREQLTNILLQEGNAKPRCSLRSALAGE